MADLALQNFFGVSDKDEALEENTSITKMPDPAPAVGQDALQSFFDSAESTTIQPVEDTSPVTTEPEFTSDELMSIQMSPEPEVTRQAILDSRTPAEKQTDDMTRLEELQSNYVAYDGFSDEDTEKSITALQSLGYTQEQVDRIMTYGAKGVQDNVDYALADLGTNIAEMMRKDIERNKGYQATGLIDYAIIESIDGSAKNTRRLLKVGNILETITSGSIDQIENGLTELNESGKIGKWIYNQINTAVNQFGRKAKSETEGELAEEIADVLGAGFEFSETLPAYGQVLNAVGHANAARRAVKAQRKTEKIEERFRKRSPKQALGATREAAEQANLRAAEKAADSPEITNEMILNFEQRLSEQAGEEVSISKVVNGNLQIDPEKTRDVGNKVNRTVATAERRNALDVAAGTGRVDFDEFAELAGGDEIMMPILNPEKFDGIVAVASELKQKHPTFFETDKPMIDKLVDLTVSGDLDGQELVDMLDNYGLSFEDYVLSVAGSGSTAGRILQKLGQIKRARPTSLKDEAATKALVEAQGNVRKGVIRIENVRRGGLVSQLATAARNVSSAVIRAPLEGLGNVVDTALWKLSNEGIGNGVGALVDPKNWKNSFAQLKYMFDGRPDEIKEYTDLILKRPELMNQFDRMFNNLNEIQEATGRGTGTSFDKIMSAAEDFTDILNVPNRWQEYLVRRATFLGELERLVDREYGIDLIEALQNGKLKSLLNDASDLKPSDTRSFINLIDDAVTKALDVTYAKQPDVPVFRSTSNFIVRNGLTTIIPFPRFMFNSMELMGQYAGGALVPLTRKMIGLVDKNYAGPLSAKDRQRISRNAVGVLGGGGTGLALLSEATKDEEDPESLQQKMSDALMSMATVGAAYQYRAGHAGEVPADYKEIYTDEGVVMDTSPQFPLRQYLYLGEATKRLKDGTFGDWFKAREFVETFTGSNFRTGTGNAILDDIAEMASGTDLTTGERVGEFFGDALGNYLGTWLVPWAQEIEAQRAVGERGLEYRDVRQDPTLDGWESFTQAVTRSPRQRMIGVSPEEEAELPLREFLFNPDAKRVNPSARVLLGMSQKNADPEYAEYLKNLGFKEYDFRVSDVPSVQRFEVDFLQKQMPLIVEAAQAREEKLRNEYETKDEVFKRKVSVDKYVNSHIKPMITRMFRESKQSITEVSKKTANRYIQEMTEYRRLPKDLRKLASIEFLDRNGRSPLDIDSDGMSEEELINAQARDLSELIVLIEAYR